MYTIIYELSRAQIDDLMRLYAPEFWTSHRRRLDVERMLANTDLIVGVSDSAGKLVGFARVLSDFVYRATLYDVIVDPGLRAQGVSRLLLDALLSHPRLRDVEVIDLSCKPEMVGFYQKWGFTTDLGQTLFMRRRT